MANQLLVASNLSDLGRLAQGYSQLDEQTRAAIANQFMESNRLNAQGRSEQNRNSMFQNQLAQQGQQADADRATREKIAGMPYSQITPFQERQLGITEKDMEQRGKLLAEQGRMDALRSLAELEMIDPNDREASNKMIDLDVGNQVAEANRRLELNKGYFSSRNSELGKTDVSDLRGVVWDQSQDKFVEKYGYRNQIMPRPSGEISKVLRDILMQRAGIAPAAIAPPAAVQSGVPVFGGSSLSPWGMPDHRVMDAFGGSQFTSPPAASRYRIVAQ